VRRHVRVQKTPRKRKALTSSVLLTRITRNPSEMNNSNTTNDSPARIVLNEIIPKTGLVIAERAELSEMLCKPKILPLKSQVLEQLMKIEEANDAQMSDNK